MNVILKKTRLVWPIVLFPHYKKSHTLTFTGKQFVKDIRFGVSFAGLYLTESNLYCRLIFPRLLIFEIELADITFVFKVEDKKGVLEVKFNKAMFGWLSRFVLSGDPAIPRNHLFLNLGDECDIWFKELNRRIA
jgi:hypothetical protein